MKVTSNDMATATTTAAATRRSHRDHHHHHGICRVIIVPQWYAKFTVLLVVVSLLVVVPYYHHLFLTIIIDDNSNNNNHNHNHNSIDDKPILRGSPPSLPSHLLFMSDRHQYDVCSSSSTKDFRLQSGLFAIIVGLEHTGTTMAASLLQSVPNLYSGFECGFLAAESPSEFNTTQPFFDWMAKPTNIHHWGMSGEHQSELLTAKCFAEQYYMLRKYSPIYQIHNTSWIVDKTPMYYKKLLSIMGKTPNVPVIITWKDPDNVRKSHLKRNVPIQIIEQKLHTFETQLRLCQSKYPDRIHILNQTELGLDADATLQKMFAFLGLQYDESYKSLEEFNKKGLPLGRPRSPPYNPTKRTCTDGNCQVTDPYGRPTPPS
jgi:hypothetical protein